jgi:hypothetical protein
MTIQKRYIAPTVVGKAMEQVGTNQDLLFACAMQPSSHLSGVALHARAPYSRGSGGPVDTLGMQPPWHGGQPWVASRESAQPVTVEDIRNIGPGDLQPWPLNNTALKSIRDSSEDPPGTPINTGVELINSVVHEVLTLHRGKGMAYELREPKQPWSWRAMLNTLSDALLQRIVGPGINGFGLYPIPNSYDHKRRHAARLGQGVAVSGPVPVWDFVAHRVDGTVVRFHPSQTTQPAAARWSRAKAPGNSSSCGRRRQRASSTR